MAKKVESVIALPFFPGGYGKKGRKCRTMRRKRQVATEQAGGVWQKGPKMSYHEAEKIGGNGAGRRGWSKTADNA